MENLFNKLQLLYLGIIFLILMTLYLIQQWYCNEKWQSWPMRYGAALYQLSLKANWELVIILVPKKPWSDELMAINIWISYMWTVEKEMYMDEFISRTGLNFFWRYFHYCLNSVQYCEDRFQIHTIYLRRRQNRKIIKKLQTSLGKPYTLNVWSRGKQ